jgi:membrane-bound lytic murein transglycosylase MltF
VKIIPADEYLEDEDILEMVNASLIPMTVVDSHKAQFWQTIFDHITVHEDITVNTGGQIAWAFRQGSPQLKAMINEFVAGHKKGTLLGNILYKRYLRDNKWVRNSLADAEVKKFNATIAYFKKYAGQYDFDWLLVAAQGYQESGLDQSKRSPVGAIGVMQLLPSTAADPNVGIPDIHVLENNIHAGAKYLRFLIDQYFADTTVDRLNQHLFALAAYNAGPARVADLRKEAVKIGLNPNVWFDNVEIVAARRIGRETVQYVRNIYKYYIAYRLIVDQSELQRRPAAMEERGMNGKKVSLTFIDYPGYGGTLVQITQQVRTQVSGIVTGAVDKTRLSASKERHAHQIHARGIDDTAIVANTALTVEDRHVQPRVVGAESGGPDDGLDLTAIQIHRERR